MIINLELFWGIETYGPLALLTFSYSCFVYDGK